MENYPEALFVSLTTESISSLFGLDNTADKIKWIKMIKRLLEILLKKIKEKEKNLQVVQSWDPNDKASSSGFGKEGFIPEDQDINYIIYFENLSTATAAAQKIVIKDILPEELEIETLKFESICLGDRIINLPEGLNISTSTIFSLGTSNVEVETTTVKLKIDITCSTQTRSIELTLEGRDIATDELTDLLVPNQYPPNGEGFVVFKVKPKKGLLSKTRITNKATIIFDTNPPIETPQIFNTVDSDIPKSKIKPLPEITRSKTFNIEWEGEDTSSGIEDITIYVSDNGGPYIPYQTINVPSGSLTFEGEYGHSYRFYSRAEDNVGNIEAHHPYDAETRLLPASIAIKAEQRAIPILGTTSLYAFTETESIFATWTASNGTLSSIFGTSTIFYPASLGIGTITASDSINTTTTTVIIGNLPPLTERLSVSGATATIKLGTESIIILPLKPCPISLLDNLSSNIGFGVLIDAYGTSGQSFKGTLTNLLVIEIEYDDEKIKGIDENSLSLYISSDNGAGWQTITSTLDIEKNLIIGTSGHLSIIALAGEKKTKFALDLSNVIVYPNPYRLYKGERPITFANLTEEATIKIFNINGEEIARLYEEDSDGIYSWRLPKNLASGVYIYCIINGKGQKALGKIGIVK